MGRDIELIVLATGERRPLAAPGSAVRSSGDWWSGIRVQHVRSPAAEWPECFVPNTVVGLLVGDGCAMETWWPGRRASRWTAAPDTVFITPARMPAAHVNFAPTENIHVEITPAILAAVGGTAKPVDLRPEYGVSDTAIRQLVTLLGDELHAADGERRLYAESLGVALAAHICERYRAGSPNPVFCNAGLSVKRLRLVQEYVDAHLDVNFGLTELVNIVDLNPDYFIRAFKKSTGLPPHKYLVIRRVERAKAMLRNATFSVAEVAKRSGFGSQSSFIRAFKSRTGQTPREYRRTR